MVQYNNMTISGSTSFIGNSASGNGGGLCSWFNGKSSAIFITTGNIFSKIDFFA